LQAGAAGCQGMHQWLAESDDDDAVLVSAVGGAGVEAVVGEILEPLLQQAHSWSSGGEGIDDADAECRQCAGTLRSRTHAHVCCQCGVLCQLCVEAHARMRCFREHAVHPGCESAPTVCSRASAVEAAQREGATALEGGGADSLASPGTETALDCRRERWHWRWSESLPVPEPHEPPPQAELSQNALPATDRWATSALGAWNMEQRGGDLLHRPRSVAVSGGGAVFVCDNHVDSKVKVFDADGSFLRFLGADFGVGEGQLDCPTAVAVDDENGVVFVSDATSNRIQGMHACKTGIFGHARM